MIGGMPDPALLPDPASEAAPYLAALNDAQRRAVEAVDGPVLVLAGAGTGKTRVLTTRLAHILAMRRAFPSELLAVTFTNKAAREMRERLEAMIGRAADGVWLGTFHAIAARILRRHAEAVGLKSSFTILDTDDQLRLLKQILQAEDIDERRWPARVLLAVIQRWKDRGLAPDKVSRADADSFADGRAIELYQRYQERLRHRQRGRFRRSAVAQPDPVHRATPTFSPNITGAFAMCWSTSIRTPMSRSICGCACWPRPGAICAASATTTSRSTAGAAPRSATSCASKAIFPAPRSSASRRTTARPRTSSAPPPE